MTALNSFPTFVSHVDILTEIFGLLVYEREIVGPISCPSGSVVAHVVTITKRRKFFFFFFFDMSLRISLRIQCVVAVLGVLWPRGITYGVMLMLHFM